MAAASSDTLDKARKRVQQAIERAEAEQKRRLQAARIDLANQGIRAFHQNHHMEAARKLMSYLRILEDWKGVDQGGLNPGLFDPKKDAAELLLISGVYWILVRLFDATKAKSKRGEFVHFLEKYILFSKGMLYQRLCAETLRKYIAVGKPRHKSELRNAYKMIGVTKCFVATALVDVTDVGTLPSLRQFRDQVLAQHSLGRRLIAIYYRVGPGLADLTDRLPSWARRVLGKLLDRVAISVKRYLSGSDEKQTARPAD